MHFSFIPYGKREAVERFLRDMEAQKHLLKMTKDGQEKSIYIDAQVRMLPFGVFEYVCPKEDKNIVLTTLGFSTPMPYNISKRILVLRTLLRYKKAPKFTEGKKYLWNREHVSIIPIGIREDRELVGSLELDEGFTHEAI